MSKFDITIAVTGDEGISEELLTKVKAVIAKEFTSIVGHVKVDSKVAHHISSELFHNAAVNTVFQSSPSIEIK